MEVSVFASSLMQHLIYVCVERLPNWELTQSFRPPPTQANTLCVCLRVESGHRWSAVASKWCQPLQCRSQKLNFNQKAKKKKKKRRKVEREKLQTNRDTKKEATCCLCESGIVWVCVASMINETVLNVSLTWPHTHTHTRAALHRYSPSECIRISVQHKLNPTRVQATSLNLLALSWIPGPIVQFVKNTTSLLNAWRCDLAGPHRNWNPMRVKIIIFA